MKLATFDINSTGKRTIGVYHLDSGLRRNDIVGCAGMTLLAAPE